MSLNNVFEDIRGRAAANSPIGSSLKLDFGDGQVIHLDGTGESNNVTTEDKDAACLVHIKLDDMRALLSGDLNPMMAFMTGKIKVKGDMGIALKLQNFLG
jgi:acyl-CoA dehydrogenase